MLKDELFLKEMKSFEFNQAVTDVFDDMIQRSVPFYHAILHQIAQLVGSNARIYDLGCSTGALVPFLKKRHSGFHYIGVDKSPFMLERAKKHADKNVEFLEGDLVEGVALSQPTVIVCNLVLQFIHPMKREALIQDYMGALPNGENYF